MCTPRATLEPTGPVMDRLRALSVMPLTATPAHTRDCGYIMAIIDRGFVFGRKGVRYLAKVLQYFIVGRVGRVPSTDTISSLSIRPAFSAGDASRT